MRHDPLTLILCIIVAIEGWAIWWLERALTARLDTHARRLAKLDAGYPYDVACPVCSAKAGEPCDGARGFTEAHSVRYDASPDARAAASRGRE